MQDPVIIVSCDSHVGPRLRQDLRGYCPQKYVREFDAFVADHRNALKWMHNFTRFDPIEPGAYGLGAKVDASGANVRMSIRKRRMYGTRFMEKCLSRRHRVKRPSWRPRGGWV